jgi:Fe-S-cluster-containing hydrogenase component 2
MQPLSRDMSSTYQRHTGTECIRLTFMSLASAPKRIPTPSRWSNRNPACCRRPRLRCAVDAAEEHSPRRSLADGTWFKMICGASSQDLPRIRNLALLYTLLGVDCIDAAADPAVVAAVRDGFSAAAAVAASATAAAAANAATPPPPWLMVSVNDDEDPHFRKAFFHASNCPPACPRPCEQVCPADAIDASSVGVLQDVCYGCGRCVPVCPESIVSTISFVHTPTSIVDLIQNVDAIEIHTQSGHDAHFARLWSRIGDTVCSHVKLLAISFPYPGSDAKLRAFLRSIWTVLLSDLPDHVELVWQTDGRPMSGDIGRGTARASVKLAGLVRDALRKECIRGHVQPAGGTNDASALLLDQAGLLHTPNGVAGIAVGGYARKVGLRFPPFFNLSSSRRPVMSEARL